MDFKKAMGKIISAPILVLALVVIGVVGYLQVFPGWLEAALSLAGFPILVKYVLRRDSSLDRDTKT
jgi:ABC-type uncharacterized transport system permease subunit